MAAGIQANSTITAMTMIDLTEEQAAPRIKTLLTARESNTLDFKRVSGKMVGKALSSEKEEA